MTYALLYVAAGGAAILGVTAPVQGAVPVDTITDATQYTGIVTWSPVNNPFSTSTVYTATITLTAKAGYTLTGVAANYFTVAGAAFVTNPANSGVITAVFPATGLSSNTTLSAGTLGGRAIGGGLGSRAAFIGSSSGLTVTLPANDAAALVLTKGNANSVVKYVQLQSTGGSLPQPANDDAYTGTYVSGMAFDINSSNDRIWLKVTAEDGITVRYFWIIVTVGA